MLFFFNDTATTEIYTLSLHDALPIFDENTGKVRFNEKIFHSDSPEPLGNGAGMNTYATRSEEHTSELQSLTNIVCRLLLEKKQRRRPYAVWRQRSWHTLR